MRAYACPACQGFVDFEDLTCRSCHRDVALHHETSQFHLLDPEGTWIDGRRWDACPNREWGCNWLVAEDSGSPWCFSGSLIRRRPDPDDTLALEKLADTSAQLRHLVYQLLELGLPVSSYDQQEGGLAFDLISSQSTGEKVTIGHADGVITIDLVESLDAYRESLRVRLGEPYRTMLGHLRHEVGHYFQNILVERRGGDLLDRCRTVFGDERASYADAIARHYRTGAPSNWREEYISEYATMHPWEDFAECFAHYLHITDTLDTAAWSGLVLRATRTPVDQRTDIAPPKSYHEASFDEILEDWHWASLLLNRINRSMGKGDLYPFAIIPAVARKLTFVHEVVRTTAARLSPESAAPDGQ